MFHLQFNIHNSTLKKAVSFTIYHLQFNIKKIMLSKKQYQKLLRRFQYEFDNLMTGGLMPLVIILALFALTLTFIITTIGVFFYVQEDPKEQMSYLEAYWQVFMHVIDQGTITDKKNWSFRLLMLTPTFFGIFTMGTLVALITTRVNIILGKLRKGRSIVLEENHTVILGWSSKIFPIIHELIKANANQKRSCIVILANKDKIEMQDEIKQKIGDRQGLRVVCRTGNPIDLDDLDIVNLQEAKAVIVVSPDDNLSDTQNVKTILAITNHPKRRPKTDENLYNIVAELQTENNKEIANIIGGDELTLVISNEVIARIAVQTCLQAGLSAVYNVLLDFDNVDIYFHTAKKFTGLTFYDALFAFENITVIGLQRKTGLVMLNPKAKTKINDGDKLIILAEDDDNLPEPDLINPRPIEIERITEENIQIVKNEKFILILGWNAEGATIVQQIGNYVVQGSKILILSNDITQVEKDLELIMPIRNVQVSFKEGDVSNRKILGQLPLIELSNIMILSYSDTMPVQEADAITLVCLMHLRDLKAQRKCTFTIVSEMLDLKNRTLAEVAKPDDFIISDHIISLIIAQLSENRELKVVFEELFDSQGAEFYLKPAEIYVNLNQDVNFYTVTQAAIQREEVAVGYRIREYADNPEKNYGIVLNPQKHNKVKFVEGDRIIVIAQDL